MQFKIRRKSKSYLNIKAENNKEIYILPYFFKPYIQKTVKSVNYDKKYCPLETIPFIAYVFQIYIHSYIVTFRLYVYKKALANER